MSSSTALLPKPAKKDDHPIFLRVCHSPWLSIGQKSLVALRILTAAYMIVSSAMIMDYEFRINNHGYSAFFEFPNVAYGLLTVYQVVGALWTFMHLHYPHHNSQPRSMSTRLQKILSPPASSENSTTRHWFRKFYHIATTFPHVATFIHWAILIPKNEAPIPVDEIFGHGWFREFFVINKYAVSSAVALMEVFIYSSIRRQTAHAAHIAGMAFFTWLYVAWAYVGHEVTGKYAYFFFDHKKIGWEYTTSAIAALAVLSNAWFGFNYGLTALREKLTRKSEHKSHGYTTLPQ